MIKCIFQDCFYIKIGAILVYCNNIWPSLHTSRSLLININDQPPVPINLIFFFRKPVSANGSWHNNLDSSIYLNNRQKISPFFALLISFLLLITYNFYELPL